MGETGVGKSTFVNAFVNYLTFDTLAQAEQNDPPVVIPVSFITTTGDDFDEITVKFGDIDPNENFQNDGESVTQYCRSYIFDLNERLRLRLIDTPGFGDTRGPDQDEKNMNNILTYIDQLSHLNGICLLLKPNSSKVDGFFRSCVKQLFTYVTETGYKNIGFCFTNSRSTFYGPGNTGSLLKLMLKQDTFSGIHFESKNTFFVDSESFRYLAAKRCKAKFKEYIVKEYVDSWKRSVTESVRMLRFIQRLQPYYPNKCRSLRKTSLDVAMLGRPLMEMLRLAFFNWKTIENGLHSEEMIIKSSDVGINICSNCTQQHFSTIGSSYIIQYDSVKKENVSNCQCPFNEKHFLIEYTVQRQSNSKQIVTTSTKLQEIFQNYQYKYHILTRFLQQNRLINKHHPFLSVLKRFLDEETYICEKCKSNNDDQINKQMHIMLSSLLNLHENYSEKPVDPNKKLTVDDIYKIIDELMSIPEITQQIECIKRSRQFLLNATERTVEIPSIKNSSFAVLMNSN